MKRKIVKNPPKNKPSKGKANPTVPIVKHSHGPVLKTYDSVRKYLNKVIRKLEDGTIEPKIANSVVLFCNLILSCQKHQIEREIIEGRLLTLEQLFVEFDKKSKSGF